MRQATASTFAILLGILSCFTPTEARRLGTSRRSDQPTNQQPDSVPQNFDFPGSNFSFPDHNISSPCPNNNNGFPSDGFPSNNNSFPSNNNSFPSNNNPFPSNNDTSNNNSFPSTNVSFPSPNPSVPDNNNVTSTNSSMTPPIVQNLSGSIYAGTAVDKMYFSNQEYTEIVKKDFDFLTPANVMKWDATERSPGVFSFADADKIVQFGKQNGKKMRGHTAVWYNQVPQWLKQLDATALVNATQCHIKTVLQHYKDDLYSFDVCNEVLGDDGALRNSFWSQKLGDSFIEMAFQAAIDAGTNIKLYINDFSVEQAGKKSDALYAIAKKLAENKLLHGVGLQGHIIVGQMPSLEALKSNLKRFVDLGLEVAYTEVDIRIPLPASPKDLAQQAKEYSTIVRACKETKGCVGVSVWGVGSSDSWVPSTYHGYGDALLFDDNYKPTKAFDSFEAALKGQYTN